MNIASPKLRNRKPARSASSYARMINSRPAKAETRISRLLRGMWKGVRPCRPWLVSLLTAALVYKLVPGAWYVAAGAVSGLICAALLAPRS